MRERLIGRQLFWAVLRITPARAGKTLDVGAVGQQHRDHPRSCGKDTIDEFNAQLDQGSPPLVRERLGHAPLEHRVVGITPARAGKTDYREKWISWKRDHPRSCGKDLTFSVASETFLGSPPLVRERRTNNGKSYWMARITPARAGKTTSRTLKNSCKRDHPRSCGKDDSFEHNLFIKLGSPPLVRERLFLLMPSRRFLRITPARAGKTSYSLVSSHIIRDHPRSCGKDSHVVPVIHVPGGSPPLVRERRTPGKGTGCIQRITPARAGKTRRCSLCSGMCQDHPRSCGKDSEMAMAGMTLSGSPPLVRERPKNIRNRPGNGGITPARAGKTGTVRRLPIIKEDHPRSCGKDWVDVTVTLPVSGSPPLVRERRSACAASCAAHGITPARAGKTV